MDPQLLMALLGPEGMMGMGSAAPLPIPQVPSLPPPQLMGDSMMPPSIAPPAEAYRSEPMGGGVPSLGQSLEPSVPMPMARPEGLGSSNPVDVGSATEMSGAAKPGGGNDLLKTLQGVKAPAAPTPQKVSTPHAPQLQKIQAGGFADLLASLGIGPQQALPGLKLPSTLGQALGGR